MDGAARLSGMDWSTGFSLGAIWKPSPDFTLGLAYQSAIFHRLTGPLTFTLDSAGLGAAIRGATGLFTDTRATAKLATPDMLLLGARKKLSRRFHPAGGTGLDQLDPLQEPHRGGGESGAAQRRHPGQLARRRLRFAGRGIPPRR